MAIFITRPSMIHMYKKYTHIFWKQKNCFTEMYLLHFLLLLCRSVAHPGGRARGAKASSSLRHLLKKRLHSNKLQKNYLQNVLVVHISVSGWYLRPGLSSYLHKFLEAPLPEINGFCFCFFIEGEGPLMNLAHS